MTKKVVKLTADPEKVATVECERQRLMELFAGADQNRLDFIRDAVQQVAWLGITILELQADVDERGPVVTFKNGKEQEGLQANPACKILKDYQQLYNTQFRALLPVLPEKHRSSGKLDWLRSQQEIIDSLFDTDDDPEKMAEREIAEREYEKRRKKGEEDLQRAIEQQRREREQKQASGLI